MKKKPWSRGERLIAAALVLCLAAACVLFVLFTREANVYTEAQEDYNELESYVTEGLPEEDEATAAPDEPTPTPLPEEESEEDDVELLVILHNEQVQAERAGATATPLPTPPPTAAPSQAGASATPAPTLSADIGLASVDEATQSPTATPSPSPTPSPTPYDPLVGSAVTEEVRYTVDFDSLQAINEDVRAWLIQEDTGLSYPVVQGEDNDYYLNHLYTGNVNQTGSIFVDCGNAAYFTDMVTYLYGHNRKDGAMFASVPEYISQEYADAHPSFYLITPYEDYRLDVFACIRGSVDDKDGWHTKSFDGKDEFQAFVDSVMALSPIRTDVSPEWGDQILAMCTCTNEVHEERYIVFTRMSPISYQTDESVSVMKLELDTAETLSRVVTLPTERGEYQYYAQNDPLWASMRYEVRGGTGRRFGSGGSGPAAMAMVAASLTDEENLWWLSYYSGREEGLTFCTCSVNQYFCNHRHAQYKLETPAEFRRYLPIAMASFATGNNQWNETSRTTGGTGTKATFMKRVSEIFGLYFEMTKEQEIALSMLQRGGMVITSASSPFKGGRHYLVLAAVDEEYVYILEPYYTEDYDTNPPRELEQLEQGVFRAKLEDWENLRLGTYYLFKDWPWPY